ncbi:MAG: threonine synthase [Clostridia bacterium]|nr:threonine synthase [Clostridia bacterium]
MSIKYVSTRIGDNNRYSPAEVILRGLTEDGGLFLPTEIPAFDKGELEALAGQPYPAVAADVLHRYFPCFSLRELRADAEQAYGEAKFPDGAAPLRMLDDKIFVCELWHGPTCAFKDMALQMLPRLVVRAMKKLREKRTALFVTATSGDTGKAAMEGFCDVAGTAIKVFFPSEGVSDTQRLQMITQEGENVSATGINGNFDDAQKAVKTMLADRRMRKKLHRQKMFLCSANSINWGRLVSQIVYYVYAYNAMVRNGALLPGEEADVCVPSGNFGNILAAWMAKKMGVPFGRLICASNKNNVLTEFFETGVYDTRREFWHTISPSMDILTASNLERLLSFVAGPVETTGCMERLRDCGVFGVEEAVLTKLREDFVAFDTGEQATLETIARTWADRHYLCDPHTAVALSAARRWEKEPDAARRVLVVSTASPYKFSESVYTAIADRVPEAGEDAMALLHAATREPIPAPLCGLAEKPVRFGDGIDVDRVGEDLAAFAARMRLSR